MSFTEITDITPYNAWVTEWETANTALSEEEGNLTLDQFREWRNGLLYETDWTVLPDSPLSADKQAEWKTYRQKLRDLPANTSEPYRVDLRPDTPS